MFFWFGISLSFLSNRLLYLGFRFRSCNMICFGICGLSFSENSIINSWKLCTYSSRLCTSGWSIPFPKRRETSMFMISEFLNAATEPQNLCCPAKLSQLSVLIVAFSFSNSSQQCCTRTSWKPSWTSPTNLKTFDLLQPQDLWILRFFESDASCSATRCFFCFNQAIHAFPMENWEKYAVVGHMFVFLWKTYLNNRVKSFLELICSELVQ